MSELSEAEKQELKNKKFKLICERDIAIQERDDSKAEDLLKQIKIINQRVYYPKKKKQPKPRFFQAVLEEVDDVIDHVYPFLKTDRKRYGYMTIEERMGENASCPECDCNSWILHPKESVQVSQGGKAYCDCMECGYTTQL
jgi:hypothetical protein